MIPLTYLIRALVKNGTVTLLTTVWVALEVAAARSRTGGSVANTRMLGVTRRRNIYVLEIGLAAKRAGTRTGRVTHKVARCPDIDLIRVWQACSHIQSGFRSCFLLLIVAVSAVSTSAFWSVTTMIRII